MIHGLLPLRELVLQGRVGERELEEIRALGVHTGGRDQSNHDTRT